MTPESSSARIASFCKYASKAIDKSEQSESPYLLLEAINRIVPFKFAMSVVYQPDNAPIYVADTFISRAEKRAISLYLDGTYILNPVYNAYLAGLRTGVHRIRELAPDNYFSSDYYREFKVQQLEDEEIGYRTYGWPAGMEEIVIAVELPAKRMAEISLHRPVRVGGFSEADLQLLSGIEPMIGAIYRGIWRHIKLQDKPQSGKASSLEALLRNFGAGILSARECEVAHMILKGHSSESISSHLDISITTVKTHRKHLYAKLGLSTQQELFSVFLNSLDGALQVSQS